MVDGVAHVEVDAEANLELVRRLDIRRTPTVLVLGPDGEIVRRASGQRDLPMSLPYSVRYGNDRSDPAA
jgi:hypothetical protein